VPLFDSAVQSGRRICAASGFDVLSMPKARHLHKPAVIGRFGAHNVIQPVWISDGLIAPEPWSRWLPKDAPALRRAG
jgi:urea transport system substrate-binding protein